MLGRFFLAACLTAVLCVVGEPLPVTPASAQPARTAQAPTDVQAEACEEVRRAEVAFARTMAERDHEAFTRFLAADAVFVGSRQTYRGSDAVARGWKRFFSEEAAPFSWRPEQVEVLASGGLALSSGPVIDADGQVIGTFNSIWRREPDGAWRVVFDKGCPACDEP